MRSRRLTFLFLAFYMIFIGGSAYYVFIFPLRLFHHAFITILLALWLANRIRTRSGLPSTSLNPFIYTAVALWMITSFASPDRRMALENTWFLVIHTPFFFVLVDLFQRGRQKLVMETQFILAATVVFITTVELSSWYFGLGIRPGTDIGWFNVMGPGAWLPLRWPPRMALAMNVSTLLAGYVAPLITLSIGWALTVKRRDYRITLMLLAMLLAIVLLLTLSRGGILSLTAALGVLIVFQLARWPRLAGRKVLRPLIGLGIIGILGLGALAMVFTLGRDRAAGTSVRMDMVTSGVEMALDNPLFGVGPGIFGREFRSYREQANAYDEYASAHNAYVNTAAETGLLGIIVSLALGLTLLRTWWYVWNEMDSPARKLRVEVAIAALIGVGVHSMVDVFTVTPVVLVILLLVAYSVTGHRTTLDSPPKGQLWPAIAALILILGYGVWLVQIDRAHLYYQLSLAKSDTALDDARTAARLDPSLTLYELQIANLLGQQVIGDPTTDIQPAITAYERAVALEPTWDVGWINLAALEYRAGNPDRALQHLETAWAINPRSPVVVHRARLAEEISAPDEEEIIAGYVTAIALSVELENRLPLSDFWTQTPLRRAALERFIAAQPADIQYRILAVHDPDRAHALIAQQPSSAAQWWITGEYALTVLQDATAAIEAFSEAINISRRAGDYYASRARAAYVSDPAAARRDLDMAYLLGTRFEFPNTIRARMEDTPAEMRRLLFQSLPPRIIRQQFAAVLYGGRIANFDLFPEMRFPGPGRSVMEPWYTLANALRSQGRLDDARQVYNAIIEYAPDEVEARQSLAALGE